MSQNKKIAQQPNMDHPHPFSSHPKPWTTVLDQDTACTSKTPNPLPPRLPCQQADL